MPFKMSSVPTRSTARPVSSAASLVLHGGFVLMGIVTTLLGPMLPILIGRWTLSDQRAGLFFSAQFCGSMLGVSSLGPLLRQGYRHTLVCGFSLIAAGVAGLNLGSNIACLAATVLFGCGLGQALSGTNLWVAEVARSHRVAALSILNVMWGIGAIASSPSVMIAQRHGATLWLLYAIAACSLLTALILMGMNLEPRASEDHDTPMPVRQVISLRSTLSLAALFFLYVGCENSVAGWVASLTKRMHIAAGDFWALTPMFFWGGLFGGRAVVPLLPLRRNERTLLLSGLILAMSGTGLLLHARTFVTIAICVAVAGLGFASIFPILVAWLVKAFGERSRRIASIMFALAGLGGATMPWFVGLTSTKTGSLRAGLLVPLGGCVAMFALLTAMLERVFRETTQQEN
jgi:FHS family glucose/mannose:H+ symporter-like MFS transporter